MKENAELEEVIIMANMRNTKNPMPEQAPCVRNKNFLEVTTGYTPEMAMDEAQRCLNCKHKPCMQGCPVAVKIPEFIRSLPLKNFYSAHRAPAPASDFWCFSY